MKKILMGITIVLLLCGCDNEIEDEKNKYLAYKSNLKEQESFTKDEDLPCDITISIDRVNEEEISYRAIIDNVKEDMYNVRALLIHDSFTEDIFPSVGIFEEKEDLIKDNEEVKGLQLVGYIETTKEIDEIDLELRIWIEYTTASGKIKNIYYKTTE